MVDHDDGLFKDAILLLFRKRKTGFLTTETILKEIHFQKAVNPKEDRERLDAILSRMRDQELVLTNQPKFVALTPAGKMEADGLPEERIAEVEKELRERTG